MNFKEYLLKAWNLTIGNIVPLLIITLVMTVVSFLTLGILAPVMVAGYMQAILLMIREGREPKPGDLFTHMRLFVPLFLFSIVFFILFVIGLVLLILPGLLLGLVVTYTCLYMIPLMTDRRLGLLDAIKESYAMAKATPFAEHLVLVILFVGISALGGAVMLGTLFTQPLATVFLMLVYDDRRAGGASSRSGMTSPPPPPPPPSS